ncbi:MAG: SRPBCC family protein [Solirubrobacterales bacterium]
MRRWTQATAAPPEAVWTLLARPDEWHRWAPHVRGAWALGDPEVEGGRVGFVRLGGVIPVPARITAVEEGRSWTWFVPPVFLRHEVTGSAEGSEISLELWAAGPIEAAAAETYGRALPALLRKLAGEAEREP